MAKKTAIGGFIPEIEDYRFFLEREYAARVKKNPSYSMRAYARDIGLLPSRMSEIMSGKKGFSVQRAYEISQHLNLKEEELEIFITSVSVKHSRSLAVRQSARKKFETLLQDDGFSEMDLEKFKVISEWHHIALIHLLDMKGFSSNHAWIAQRLGISEAQVGEALQRLINLQLVHRDAEGNYHNTHVNLETPKDIPSQEIRNFHRQILKKAEASLEKHKVEERDFSTLTLAIRQDRLEEAKKMIREFRRKFCVDIQSEADADRIYAMSIQFFPLDEMG